jgi:glutamate carboxypeptidase
MDRFLAHVHGQQPALIALLRELVQCESPSDDRASIGRFVELLADRTSDIAAARTFDGGARGDHLLLEFNLPGRRKKGRILGLGHSDTVWPMGTLATMPWREEAGRLFGPGVLDMKSGLAFFVFAARALRDLDIPAPAKVSLLVVSDEEVGSHSSRNFTESEARKSSAVLVLEPGTGLEGKLKTARKGVGGFRLRVRGKSSHAGVDFAAGANAIVELAHQIPAIAAFSDPGAGVTVNPGLICGGTRTNVVPAEASVDVDYRVPRLRDLDRLNRRINALRPRDKRCSLEITGELNRPPMERTADVIRLFRTARRLAAGLGVHLEESSTGGGSDGNFTAGLGIPTLDGIGGVGEGAHAAHESILADRIADRTALLAKLMATSLSEKET